MEESKLLEKIHKLEISYKLYDESFCGFPMWRLFRYHTRTSYVNKITGYLAGTAAPATVGSRRPKLFSGLWQYIFKRGKLSIFMPFNRLNSFNGKYIDKFTDPIIDRCFTDREYVIIESPNYSGKYSRYHKNQTINNENRLISVQILYRILIPFMPLFYGKKVNSIAAKVKNAFGLDANLENDYYHKTAHFLAYYFFYLFWFKMLRPKRVFIVYREGYFPVIAACKHLSIPIAEFQHGITIDNTVSYTGQYDKRIDPDYFLVFGEYWKGPQFGVSLDRIHCVGWAYKDLVTKEIDEKERMDNKTILAISSPEISDALLEAIKNISDVRDDLAFHIRLHPCENYNETHLKKLSQIPNALLTTNKKDSATVLPLYSYVIGENSSVVYEALSYGCRVGLLNFDGLHAPIDKPGIKESFFILNNPQDIDDLLNKGICDDESSNAFYTNFKETSFNEFIKNYM